MQTSSHPYPTTALAQAGALSLPSLTMSAARVLLAAIFLLSGLSKLGALDGTAAYMQAMGIPGFMLWPTIVFEIGSGALIVLGYRTRITALLLSGFCLLTAALFHHDFADQIQMIMFLKNVSMAGGFLLLAAVSAGPLSIDRRLMPD